MKNILLSRDQFREKVFLRDNYKCVFCDKPAVDAHHIMERRLWSDGGYYVNNGASVCSEHHILLEKTDISVEDAREACGILKPILPSHLYDDQMYDKWGNPILPNKTRLKGELFHDESVQKILKEKLHLFIDYVKYSRTHHFPWSDGIHDDDKIIETLDHFVGHRVIATVKMDGENTSLYPDYIHARSIDSVSHPSRDWVKTFHSRFMHEIPKGWRICGENLFAQHSIRYENLPSYFMGFSIWNEMNVCLSWDETIQYFEILGIEPVPVLYDGIFDEKIIRSLHNPSLWSTMEGYVVRRADSFSYGEFKHKVAKFVREGHVQTTKHWMRGQRIIKNGLA